MKPISVKAINANIGTIPVNKTHNIILSRWKATWRERLSILFHGTIWLAVAGEVMPPLLVSGTQSFYAEIPKPEQGHGAKTT